MQYGQYVCLDASEHGQSLPVHAAVRVRVALTSGDMKTGVPLKLISDGSPESEACVLWWPVRLWLSSEHWRVRSQVYATTRRTARIKQAALRAAHLVVTKHVNVNVTVQCARTVLVCCDAPPPA
jgi:hypothetical protein